MDEQESMRELRELDEGTEWSVDGDMLSVNDEDDEEQGEDDGLAGVPAGSGFYPDESSEEEEPDETIENICDTVEGLSAMNKIEDIITIVNLRDGSQLLFTTLQRNDHIIGMLAVATMNWHSSQISAQNLEE